MVSKKLVLLGCLVTSVLVGMEPAADRYGLEKINVGTQESPKWRINVRDNDTMQVVVSETFDRPVYYMKTDKKTPYIVTVVVEPKGGPSTGRGYEEVKMIIPSEDMPVEQPKSSISSYLDDYNSDED